MSQETSIGSLNNATDEDSKLVESILKDLNTENGPSQEAPPQQQQMSPEQMKAIQMQRQMAMQQQQNLMAQQQQLAQQQRGEQKMQGNVIKSNESDLIENIKKEAKSILLVILLSLILNLEQANNILKMSPSLFVSEDGNINLQGVLLKAILIGVVYYLVKTYLF